MVESKCYLCGKKELKVVRTELRYNINRNVLKCQDCGINYLEPEPLSEDYYKNEYRKLYTPVLGKKVKASEIFDIFYPYQKSRVNEIKHILNTDMRVLDIGCSAGHFLFAIKNYVEECVGNELNKKEAEFASKTLGFKIYNEPIDETDIPFEYFDLITMFQVFEHIEDPIKYLKTVYKYLKPEGYLVVEVPNVQDALMSLYGVEEYSNFWFREPHVFNYSPETLNKMLENCGFIGEIKTTQNFNLINHLNWILNKKPQENNAEMSKPVLIKSDLADSSVRDDFNQWFEEVDKQYKKMLNKYQLGENILFIGNKKL